MRKKLHNLVDSNEIEPLLDFLSSLPRPDSGIVLNNEILLAFQHYLEHKEGLPAMTSAWRFLRRVQEVIQADDQLILLYRLRRASCRAYELRAEDSALVGIEKRDFLAIKEKLTLPDLSENSRTMEIDLAPFYDYGPSLKDPDAIGNGIRHLNRYMSSNLASQSDKWNEVLYEFLKLHHLQGVQLLLDGKVIQGVADLESTLEDLVYFLERSDYPEDLVQLKEKMLHFGFLEGWGDSRDRILETVQLLQDILEQPNEDVLEEFLARIPMVSKVSLISPHGWFGQENVLGRPDTGGQVVYVLDQATALEKYLRKDLQRSGIDIHPKVLIVTRLIPESDGTTSDQRLEKVHGTKNVWILRVPLRSTSTNEVLPHWISRFKIWPYLDQFAVDAEQEITQVLQGLPDLIVGNYSDGNLVATLLSKSMGVTQCNIAHALEKSKYLFSDLYWQDFEQEYNFSIQFMADLISMNLANFIISSTRQEITGTDTSIGQYESYQFFTMPGLVHVVSGINLFHPRFNVIPPGVSNDVFFPYSDSKGRQQERIDRVNDFLFFDQGEDSRGCLANPDLPPIFSIARLDRIKNLSGLVEAYGSNPELRKRANLVIIASLLDPDLSKDAEEAAEIRKMHELIDHYELEPNMRWIGRFLGKEDSGEVYRVIADRRGIFVQPALFEAFGLTILEAMHSGLPTFATQFGGPLEIIEDKKSGFLINPTDQESMVGLINDFFRCTAEDERYWHKVSGKGMNRAQTNFTWELHCRNLTRLTKVHGFWRYSTSSKAKTRLLSYCDLLFQLYYKARASLIEES